MSAGGALEISTALNRVPLCGRLSSWHCMKQLAELSQPKLPGCCARYPLSLYESLKFEAGASEKA